MKILLLGEYSGVHSTLARGLRNLGLHVDVASAGDTWKRITGDIKFDLGRKGFTGALLRNAMPFVHLPRLRSYDIIQVINPQIVTTRFRINARFFDLLLTGVRAKVFLVACGCDVPTNTYLRNEHPFPQICSECKEFDLPGHRCQYESPREAEFERRLVERIDGVIPTGIEYARAYKVSAPYKLRPWVPLPFDASAVEYRENNITNDALQVFHGLNRDGFKGTRHIRQAFALAAQALGDRARFHVFGRMPLDAYLVQTDPMNIVIDQIFGVSYGMNALLQMARGKVVIGGGQPSAMLEVGIERCPVKFTGDSIESLAAAIVSLCGDSEAIRSLGEEGRDYVRRVHDVDAVARRFLGEWTR